MAYTDYNTADRISIHVPLAGDDCALSTHSKHAADFYPRPPCGGRHDVSDMLRARTIFLSTSPLRGTTLAKSGVSDAEIISIHVPLAGDDRRSVLFRAPGHISIHVPLAGDDATCPITTGKWRISIHVPLAGDDCRGCFAEIQQRDFYPRPPCGGRPQASRWACARA